jgi:hypothetical protein
VKVFDSCAVRDQEEIWQAANMINSYTHKKGFADDISTLGNAIPIPNFFTPSTKFHLGLLKILPPISAVIQPLV